MFCTARTHEARQGTNGCNRHDRNVRSSGNTVRIQSRAPSSAGSSAQRCRPKPQRPVQGAVGWEAATVTGSHRASDRTLGRQATASNVDFGSSVGYLCGGISLRSDLSSNDTSNQAVNAFQCGRDTFRRQHRRTTDCRRHPISHWPVTSPFRIGWVGIIVRPPRP